MNEQQVVELQLENNGMKIEILNLRVQLAQALMPAVQTERDALLAQHKVLTDATKAE